MTRVLTHTHTVGAAGLEELLTPRNDIVGEETAGNGRFVLGDGPFTCYTRTVEVVASNDATSNDATGQTVRETFEYDLPRSVWRILIGPFVARGLRHRPPKDKMPLWAPPQRPDARALTALMLLATLALVIGYHGTLLGQTMTFAADEFGADTATQGVVLAVARIGGLLAILLAALADRRGRRRMMMVSLFGCIGVTALGALTPNLAGLAATQSINRGTWAASLALLGVFVAEEMPAGARAYTLGLLTMCVGLGAGIALALLPLADVSTESWRLLYAAPLAMLPMVWHCGRRLPESRRYARPHLKLSLRDHTHYLVLVCLAMFLLNLFIGPAPQFRNEFLRDERAFSAAGLSLFAVLTSTPGAIGILVGGRLAETMGRKRVAAVSGVVGSVLVAMSFVMKGPYMWLGATFGAMVLAALSPSFTVYNAELFPTSLRGRAAGIISTVAMAGSVIGLLAAGTLARAFDTFGPAMVLLALGPCLMSLLVVLRYPETAFRELEELNPEDDLGPGRDGMQRRTSLSPPQPSTPPHT